MCGIIGYRSFDIDKLDRVRFVEALEKMNHRGPDGQGLVQKNNQLIGHVRLSIIDLEGGAQPIEIDDHVITFNGEIYNFKEIQKELIQDIILILRRIYAKQHVYCLICLCGNIL